MLKNRWILAAAGLLVGGFPSDKLGAASAAPPTSAPYIIDVWGTEDGLPQSSVIAITQTRDGYLWLGTLNGLVRFDGLRFTVFDESNTPGLNSSRIVHLFEDSQGNLWIGTETAGVALVKDGRVTSLDIGRGSREGRLLSAAEDQTGAVWLYTADGQLCRYSGGQGNIAPYGVTNSYLRALIADEAGTLWLGTDRQLLGLDPREATAQSAPPPVRHQIIVTGRLDALLASSRGGHWRLANGRVQRWRGHLLERDLAPYPWRNVTVSAVCEDREGNLIVGTAGDGVFWFDADGQAAQISSRQGLSHDTVLSLHVDREGSLWVGTDGGGLNRVRRRVFEVAEASRDWVVQSVGEDAEGGLWLGFNGVEIGATYWKGSAPKNFGATSGLTNANVRAVFVDRSDQVWVGTHGGGVFQLHNDRFQPAPGSGTLDRNVFAIHQDRSGQLWLGTQGGLVRWDGQGWKVFTTRDGLSADAVRAIADDVEGNLWIGTEWGGLNRLRDGRFTAYRKADDGLPSDNISSLYVDNEGVLWIGTGGGLARFHAGKWTRYTTREGLISNGVGYLLEDGQGDLWIGSNAGLMRVKKQALNDFAAGLTTFVPFRAYGKPDGLPTSECTMGSQPGACRTREGTLWFPTIKGLVSVNPNQLKPNTNPPPVVIESVLIEGRLQSANSLHAKPPKTVTVPPGRERLEIHFTGLNLAASFPNGARFRYRLEGHEAAWTDAGNIRVARYTKLPPGHYRFQVTACNEDGVWNETGSGLAIIVEPPFWRTWWFLTTATVCLLGMIIAVVHYVSTQKLQRQLEKLRQQEALEKERSRIARDIHDQLGASLTQVSLLGELVESDKNSPGEVEAHARQISQAARDTTRTLDEIVWTVNPSNDTLDGLITYVCKYAQEYLAVAGLRYRLDVPAQLPGAAISPEVRHNVFLAAKEALTNVVRHAQASSVWIRLKLEPNGFTLEIEDNGRGVAGLDEPAAQSRNGLRNMRKRMEDISGVFSIGPAPEGGTRVRLTVPV